MVKFPEAHARLFKNKFVSRISKRTIRAPPLAVLGGKIQDRKSKKRVFRPVRMK